MSTQQNDDRASIYLTRNADDDKDSDPSRYVEMMLKCKAGALPENSQKYKKKFKIFEEGSPQEYVDVREAIAEIWRQNSIVNAEDRISIVKMLIQGESLMAFNESLAEQRTVNRTQIPLVPQMVDVALEAVALDVFDHRALHLQKR